MGGQIPMPVRDASGMQGPLQWDGEKPYYLLDNGQKHYISPTEALGAKTAAQADGRPLDPRLERFLASTPAPSSQNSFAHTASWNPTTGTTDTATNWGGLGGAVLGGAAVAAPYVLPALAGAGGASGAATMPALSAPSAVLPTGTAGIIADSAAPFSAATAAATGPSLAATPFGPASSATPAAVPGAGLASGIPSAAGASPTSAWLTPLLKAAVPAVGALTAHATGTNGGMPPELQQLLALALKRQQEQQPLFDAVTHQALAGLPTYAQKGQG